MQKNIYGYKCKLCGEVHYPFRMVCKKCKKNDIFEFDQVILPTKGKLVTFTELYSLPADFAVAKMGLGIVELENGIRMTGQLKIDDPKLGMAVNGRVEVVRSTDFDKQYGIVFYKE